jgi:dynein heavy chain 1
VNIITDLQEIKKKYSGWATMVDKFKAGQKLLDRQRFVPPSDWLYTDMVEGEWNVFRQIFQRKCGQME